MRNRHVGSRIQYVDTKPFQFIGMRCFIPLSSFRGYRFNRFPRSCYIRAGFCLYPSQSMHIVHQRSRRRSNHAIHEIQRSSSSVLPLSVDNSIASYSPISYSHDRISTLYSGARGCLSLSPSGAVICLQVNLIVGSLNFSVHCGSHTDTSACTGRNICVQCCYISLNWFIYNLSLTLFWSTSVSYG